MGWISSKTSLRNSLELPEGEEDKTEKVIGLTKRQRLLHAHHSYPALLFFSPGFYLKVPGKGSTERCRLQGQAFHTVSNYRTCCLIQTFLK